MTKLNINGKQYDVDLPADTPLLWVLRDELGLTGTKFGCGMALCAACTVHIDGQPGRACVTPISSLANKKVVTIEAIGADKVGKAVQTAWIELGVPQCGYCQAGQIMSATALLKQRQNPIGLSSANRAALDHEFDLWAGEVRKWPNIDEWLLPGFRRRMFGGEFIFSVSREFVRECAIPMLLMPGDDVVHPAEISADLARAPDVEIVAPWKGAQYRDAAMRQVRELFIRHRPGPAAR